MVDIINEVIVLSKLEIELEIEACYRTLSEFTRNNTDIAMSCDYQENVKIPLMKRINLLKEQLNNIK